MTESSKSTAVTFRCPSEVIDSIDHQAKATKQNRTDVLVDLILGSIPNVKVIERAKLPPSPAIYFVFTPDKQLLYIGKADNLQKRWNSHHKYQHFIETSLDCRIGYFTFNSVDNLNDVIEEFQNESDATPTENILVTNGQLNELRGELYALKRQFDITFSSLSAIGLENLMKRFEDLKPPSGLQDWTPTSEDRREGIVRSNLMKHFGFNSTTDLESAASFYNNEPDKYLEELSGWQCKPIEQGSHRTRFYPPSTPQTKP
ncbi:GIY-YIG nuclease family protein [Chroococcus sp. FPU101]|uniref:GIY-YIG nuclease family protein n=1 Tax=Chroococcus sp. FPU101 TaxID=1974212 RepID=UPI001A8E42D1|nr:GIY-YIG nuclease family protein [Chroococcus sp. FPU101]GFE72116.1 Excinuclease ABC C subunit domain protein [Chroococcus sp. FPU101]